MTQDIGTQSTETKDPGPASPPEAEQAKQAEELSAYEKLAQQVKTNMERLTTTVDAEAFRNTIDKAAHDLKEVGEHSWESLAKAADALKKDLATSAEHMKPALDSLGKGAEKTFNTMQHTGVQVWGQFLEGTTGALFAWRDWTGSATADFLKGVSTWSAKLGDQLDQALVYHTGEMTHGGKFRCLDCGTDVTLKKPGHLPPCPKCHHTSFKRA